MTAVPEPVIAPAVALLVIRDRINRLAAGFRQDENARLGDLALCGIVLDLIDVVTQLCPPEGVASGDVGA